MPEPRSIDEYIAALETRVAELEAAAKELDTDGDPTEAAFLARKELPGQYKLLLDAMKAGKVSNPALVQGPDDNKYVWDPNAAQPDVLNANQQLDARMAGLPEGMIQSPQTAKGRFTPAPGMPQVDPADAAMARQLKAAQLAAAQRSASGAPTAYRPGEYEGVLLKNRGEGLRNQKAERDLMSKSVLAQQQADEAITRLQEQYANGQLSLQDRDKQMSLIRSNYEAAMKGTTPWDMETWQKEQEQSRIEKQQTLARNLMSDRLQTGSSLAQGLMTGLGGIYSKVYGRTKPPLIDPFQLARDFTNSMGSDPQMTELARSVLMGALADHQPQGGS